MKKIAVFLAAVMVVAGALADDPAQWVGNSYIVANDAWYNGSGTGNPAFSDLGELSALSLGGQFQIYAQNGADWQGGSGNWMGYCIKQGDTKVIDDTFVEMTYTGYGYGDNHNNMQFDTPTATAVDFTKLSPSTQYSVEVFFGGVDGQWDAGNNFKANFTTAATPSVPEPATMSLLGLGALALALRRKLRK